MAAEVRAPAPVEASAAGRTALLVIDPLNDFIAEDGKLWPLVAPVAERIGLLPNLRRVLAAARAAQLDVVFVPHRPYDPRDFEAMPFPTPSHAGLQKVQAFARGSWGAAFHADFQPRPDAGEVVASEHFLHDGFVNTNLDLLLRRRRVERLIVIGMRANACVEATARHAAELGYHVTLVKDASAAFRQEEWEATMEVNAPGFAHAVLTARQVADALRDAARPRSSCACGSGAECESAAAADA